MSRKRLFTAV